MNYSKIGTIEGIFLLCIGILNHTILYLPQSIFNVCSTASILNVVYICALFLIILLLFIKWYKPFIGHDILDISNYLGGKILKYISGLLFIVLCLLISSIMLRNFAEGIYTAYFSHIDIKLIIFFFAFIVFMAIKFGKISIVRSNTIITFIMIISLIILIVSIIPRIELSNMYPLLGNGINATFIEGIGNLYAFSGICIIFFISPMLKNPESLSKITIFTYCIVSSILFLVICSLLLSMPFLLNVNELSPIYLLSSTIQFSEFFQDPKSLFILIWILSIISFLSVLLMFIVIIIQKLFNFKDFSALSGTISSLLFIFALMPKNLSEIIFISSDIYKYIQIGIVFIYGFLILGLAYLKKHQELKEIKNE